MAGLDLPKEATYRDRGLSVVIFGQIMSQFEEKSVSVFLEELGKASRSLSRDEDRDLAHAAEASKKLLHEKRIDVVRQANGEPMLQSCQADGTPIVVSESLAATMPSGRTIRRSGRASHEFLVACEMTRHIATDGKSNSTIFVKEPTPLTNGTCTDQIVEAQRCQFQSLRQLGHWGGAVQHYVYDRKGYKALCRRATQWHELVKESFDGLGNLAWQQLFLLEWVLFSACSAHDTQNSFRWALPGFFNCEDLAKAVYIGIESIRNSFDLVRLYIGSWVADVMRVVDPLSDVEVANLRRLWAILDLPEETVSLLAEVLQLRFIGGALYVTSSVETEDLVGLIITGLFAVFKFRKFSDSRWLTIGPSARTMVAAQLLGLSHLMGFIRERHSHCYYLNGFWRIGPDHWGWLVKLALVSYVPDAVLQSLMLDNRVALLVDELEQKLFEKFAWLTVLPCVLWDQLAAVSGEAARDLRNDCLTGARRSVAFFHYRVIREARKLPWRLCRGDVRENLRSLAAGLRPSESTSSKLWQLMRDGWPISQLVRMIQCMGDLPWTSAVAEQLHGTCAMLARYHPDYELGTLLGRCMVSYAVKLLPKASRLEKEVQKCVVRRERLSRRCPEKAGGRQVYFSELCALSRERDSNLSNSQWNGVRKKIMKRHSRFFAQRDLGFRRKYKRKAQVASFAKRQMWALEKQQADEALLKARQALRDYQSARHPLGLTDSAWGHQDLERFAEIWNEEALSPSEVQSKRLKLLVAPPMMSESLVAVLNEQSLPPEHDSINPPWATSLAHNRMYFDNVVLQVHEADSVEASPTSP